MRRSRTRVFIFMALLAAAITLIAQEETPSTQLGNFLFSVPNGWNPQQKGDAMYIFAPALLPGTTCFIVLSANDMEGDLQSSFRVLWGGFANAYRVLRGGQPMPVRTKQGYNAFYTEALAADRQGIRWHVFVAGIQYKQRIQTVMFMDNLNESSHNANFNVFRQWLSNLSFGDALPGSNIPAANAGSDPSPVAEEKPHTVPPGMLDGFYVGGAVSGRYGTGIGRNHLYFSPDGWVLKIDLNKSMIGFDVTAYRNSSDTNRSWVGRYRVDGNDIHILWQDYTEHRDVIQRNEQAANPAIDVYVPECRCTGKRFAGKYNWGLAGSGQYIQFSADGTFLDHGVTDQMILPNPFYEHPRTQRGSYTIQNQTVIFNFVDGHRGMRTFLAPKAQEKGQTFDWINLGIHTLYEEHYQNEP